MGAVVAELRDRFGERLSTAAAVREQHGKGVTWHAGHPPDAVVFAEDHRGGRRRRRRLRPARRCR